VRVVEPPDRGGPPADPQALPEFTLADYEQAIGELRGTPLLVNIWVSWCGPCRDDARLLASAHETDGDRVRFKGVEILDEPASARALMREFGWAYPSVYDPTGAVRDGPGLIGQPSTLFYDASGQLVATWTGPLSEEVLDSGLNASANADGGTSWFRGPRRGTNGAGSSPGPRARPASS